ncbi:MAG: hypothetical protein AB8G15_20330 [Saprospiraceae bacterium]
MQTIRYPQMILASLLLCFAVSAVKVYTHQAFILQYETLNATLYSDTVSAPFLKIHFKDGRIGILEKWTVPTKQTGLAGRGYLFDFEQACSTAGAFNFMLDEITLVETNQLAILQETPLAPRSMITGANIKLDIHCLVNPKACQRCAPTFYVGSQAALPFPAVEGFSTAILPLPSAKEITALQQNVQESLVLHLKNETLATHSLNKLAIQAIPKKENQNVYRDIAGDYYTCGKDYPYRSTMMNEENIATPIQFPTEKPKYELFSDTIPFKQQESIIIDLERNTSAALGLVLSLKQTQLAHFLDQRQLAYRGQDLGMYFANRLRNGASEEKKADFLETLTHIQLSYWKDGTWQNFEQLQPIKNGSSQVLLVPLPDRKNQSSLFRIKLEMAKGFWQLADLNIRAIHQKVMPQVYQPKKMKIIDGARHSTLTAVYATDAQYLVSLPGNEFSFEFQFPALAANESYEFFLVSEGYELPWIRQNWIKDQDLATLEGVHLGDPTAWKTLSQGFKMVEQQLETTILPKKIALLH